MSLSTKEYEEITRKLWEYDNLLQARGITLSRKSAQKLLTIAWGLLDNYDLRVEYDF